MEIAEARRLWQRFEPVHAIAYSSDEVRDGDRAAGLKGFWMGYFAGRAAPMGPVAAPVITATFFNFAPRMVERAVPDAWAFARPDDVVAARFEAIDRALRRLLGDQIASADLTEAADLARRAVDACSFAGRPLAAAWAEVEPPHAPHLALWWALSVLREHRGDGHVAALVSEGLDGCEAHVTLAATGTVTRASQLPSRGWTDDEWDAASGRLHDRGWLSGDSLTPDGESARRRIEDTTDRLALEPWLVLGADATDRFDALMGPISGAVVDQDEIRFPNPMGLTRR